MKRLILLAAVAAAVLAIPASAGTLGWYAAWNCNAPCTIPVYIDPAFPASEKTIILAQMAAWSVAPQIDLVEGAKNSKAKMLVGTDGFTTTLKTHGYTLLAATSLIDYKWFGWDGLPFVYCHELSHIIGFDDGAPDTPDVCPTPDHFALLQNMYPLGAANGHR